MAISIPAEQEPPDAIVDNKKQACGLFETYELLEYMLGFVDDPSDLRKLRRVNSFWHAIISKNPTLHGRWQRRRHTFFGLALVGARDCEKYRLTQAWCHGYTPIELFDPTADQYWSQWLKVDEDLWTVPFWDQGSLNEAIFEREIDEQLALANAYALVYSTRSRSSFEAVQDFQRRMEDKADAMHERIAHEIARTYHRKQNEPLRLGVIATNCDAEPESIEVAHAEGKTLARQMACPFYEVCTRSGKNVDESITAVIRDYGERCDARRAMKRAERLQARQSVSLPIRHPRPLGRRFEMWLWSIWTASKLRLRKR